MELGGKNKVRNGNNLINLRPNQKVGKKRGLV